MRRIEDIAALEALYSEASDAAIRKVARRITPMYHRWIAASRFCVLSTVGQDGTDGTPRGDDGPVVEIADPGTLLMPDWQGNNRLDSLRNIVTDGRLSLMFMVPGDKIVVRVNGRGALTDDATMRARFARGSSQPRTVIVIEVDEVYAQCPKALLRSGLWTRDDASLTPSLGDILSEMTKGEIDAVEWETHYPKRAAQTLW